MKITLSLTTAMVLVADLTVTWLFLLTFTMAYLLMTRPKPTRLMMPDHSKSVAKIYEKKAKRKIR